MRCDANISVRRHGETQLGERTEIKNLNSFRFVERALKHEIDRQISILETGGEIVRETRLYDVERDETRSMRGKELAHDYRYFPDPDLLPVAITQEMIRAARSAMPELPEARCSRYIDELGLPAETAHRLTQEKAFSDYFESAFAIAGNAKLTANWVLGNVAATLNRNEISIENLQLSGPQLGEIVKNIVDGIVSDASAKQVFEHVLATKSNVADAIGQQRESLMSDERDLKALVQRVLDGNPIQVEEYRKGKKKILGYLVGQVMSAAKGKIDPKKVNQALTEILASD